MRRVLVFPLALLFSCAGDDSDPSAAGTTGTTAATSNAPTTNGDDDDDDDDDSGPTTGGTTEDSNDSTGSDDDDDDDDTTGTTGGGDDGPNVDVSDPQLYEFILEPDELDPTVVENIETQYAHLDTRAEPIGKLVFFLSGFTNTPSSWRNHGIQLAGHGFHVVEPHYANSWSCGGMGGSCNEDTRWEALVGEDTSTVIDISRADSAEGRVITMLEYLAVEHPGGDWGYYLTDDGELRYEHVIIAGISHGASSTGLFATRRAFHRAVMHSGGWWNVGKDPMTPIDMFYGLSHTDDEQHQGHLDAWDSAGMVGAPTSIDGMAPPYGDSRRLITSVPNGYPHCSVCVHGESPMDGDGYVFDPAWRVMYGAPQLD